jgi:glucose/arabinose dehydrogenase
VRLSDQGNSLSDPQTILDDIPTANFHAGGRLAFGPDQRLYVTTGDANVKKNAQDVKSLSGKILRLNTDGTTPEDNPFPDSLVYSYGHRNSQGLAWDAKTHELYATEHGPSGFDGPPGGDEFNHILPGENYGWPKVSHDEKLDGAQEPLLTFTPAVAPSDLLFYTGTTFPQFTDTFLFAALKGEGVYQITVNTHDPEKIAEHKKVEGIDAGRIRSITEAPDGSLYLLTSNVDGRGKPVADDDRILHIVPKENK